MNGTYDYNHDVVFQRECVTIATDVVQHIFTMDITMAITTTGEAAAALVIATGDTAGNDEKEDGCPRDIQRYQ